MNEQQLEQEILAIKPGDQVKVVYVYGPNRLPMTVEGEARSSSSGAVYIGPLFLHYRELVYKSITQVTHVRAAESAASASVVPSHGWG